jgi:hypothetical protein
VTPPPSHPFEDGELWPGRVEPYRHR